MEQLDRRGVMVWDTAPVNIVQNDRWAQARRSAGRRCGSTRRWCCATAATRRCWRSRSPTSCRYRCARARSTFIRAAAAAGARARPDADGGAGPRGPLRRARRRPPGVPACSTRWASTSTSAGTAARCRRARPPGADKLGAYYDRLHRLQPRRGPVRDRVRRRGQPPRPGGRKGTYAYQSRFLRRHLAEAVGQALPERRLRVGAARLPRALGVERGQPQARAAVEPEGAARRSAAGPSRVTVPSATCTPGWAKERALAFTFGSEVKIP